MRERGHAREICILDRCTVREPERQGAGREVEVDHVREPELVQFLCCVRARECRGDVGGGGVRVPDFYEFIHGDLHAGGGDGMNGRGFGRTDCDNGETSRVYYHLLHPVHRVVPRDVGISVLRDGDIDVLHGDGKNGRHEDETAEDDANQYFSSAR